MIAEILNIGGNNAMTGRQLANYFNCDIREITQQIERERRQGQPICAGSGETPGYFLPENAEELANYCGRLEHRAKELNKTRQALTRVLRNYATIKGNGGVDNGKTKGSE